MMISRAVRFLRAAPFRSLATEAKAAAHTEQHQGGLRLWKILSFTVAVPGVLVCYINAHQKETERREEHPELIRPEFIHYDHLRRRTKRFPWGDGNHSLFHNHHTNALPDGYEE